MAENGGKQTWASNLAGLLVWAAAIASAWKMAHVTWLHSQTSGGIDFYFFWEAGAKALSRQASTVYLPHMSAAGVLQPLGYPPPFLLFAAPIALLTYGAALLLWLMLTGAGYIATSGPRIRLALINPPAAYNALLGQTGFLTSAMLLGGARLLPSQPLVGGALLGAMIIKPHLALLIPVALIAGREWRALGTAAATAGFLAGAAALAFGPSIYADWWRSVSQYRDMLQDGFWHWNMLASPYGALRWSGLENVPATLGQIAIAVVAAWLVAVSWRQCWSSRVAVLAAATLLASPYLFTYDSVMMIAPLAYLAAGRTWRAVAIWALMLEPLFAKIGRYDYVPFLTSNMPNTISLAAALSLFFLWRDRHDQGSRSIEAKSVGALRPLLDRTSYVAFPPETDAGAQMRHARSGALRLTHL